MARHVTKAFRCLPGECLHLDNINTEGKSHISQIQDVPSEVKQGWVRNEGDALRFSWRFVRPASILPACAEATLR